MINLNNLYENLGSVGRERWYYKKKKSGWCDGCVHWHKFILIGLDYIYV